MADDLLVGTVGVVCTCGALGPHRLFMHDQRIADRVEDAVGNVVHEDVEPSVYEVRERALAHAVRLLSGLPEVDGDEALRVAEVFETYLRDGYDGVVSYDASVAAPSLEAARLAQAQEAFARLHAHDVPRPDGIVRGHAAPSLDGAHQLADELVRTNPVAYPDTDQGRALAHEEARRRMTRDVLPNGPVPDPESIATARTMATGEAD